MAAHTKIRGARRVAALLLSLAGALPASAAVAGGLPPPVPAVRAALTHHVAGRDTVPPLSEAELRELRRLERADARERRRRGSAPAPEAYDPQRARGANPFARAALPTGFVGVVNLAFAASVANPAVFVALSVLSFAAAVVFGTIGVRRARRRGLRRRGLAIAGIVLGAAGAAFYAVLAAVGVDAPGE